MTEKKKPPVATASAALAKVFEIKKPEPKPSK